MKTVYFILGMHRSGTSALGGMLNIMGLEFGSDLMVANERNPKGYFENNFVYQLNKKILSQNNTVWYDLHFQASDIDKNDFDDFVQEAEQIMSNEFKYSENFVIKDPRISILFPIWEQASLNL